MYELSNVVETALAKALVLAAEAKRWDVVVQIASELAGRRVGNGRRGSNGREPARRHQTAHHSHAIAMRPSTPPFEALDRPAERHPHNDLFKQKPRPTPR